MKTTLKKHIFIGCMVCLAILTIYVLPKNSMVANAAECAEETTGATVCSLSDPYTAPICFLPGSASTLLVKNGRVAINSVGVDASGAALLVNGLSGVRATTLINYSDVRIKTNIQKINNALADITRLNGYQFTWIDSGKPDFGVLAQEVEKVFATMVSEDANGIKAVNYSQLLAPIIEAIHEINTRVDELTREAQEQALRIDTLEK